MDDNANRPAPGTVWEYKGKTYRIVRSEKVLVKDKGDANWHQGIEYVGTEDTDGAALIRRLDDFNEKFVQVGE